MNTENLKKFLAPVCVALLVIFIFAGGAPAGAAKVGGASDQPAASGGEQTASADKKLDIQAAAEAADNMITREGLNIEFLAGPAGARGDGVSELMEGQTAEIAFRVTDAENGKPVRGLYPVVWMDIGAAFDALHSKTETTCKDRVGLYLQGLVGIRPLIDLNSYFVMVMNQDPTIMVIDPIVGIQGRTSLYAQVILKRAGADWAKTDDEKRLFVSMPVADMVAVVDLEHFAVANNVPAGDAPTRVVLQQDGKYLWVGNDSRKPDQSGVTVIDTQTLQQVAQIPTGAGHHELALSANDRYAFVTNRDDGTITVIDTERLKKVKDLRVGPKPIALAYSALSRSLYVADGETGEITVVDDDLKVVSRIRTAPGLGPMRVSQDGRWLIAVNPNVNEVYVVDASTNRRIHTVSVGGKPFELAFSPAFAYIRSLENEYVSMINLAQLDKGGPPLVTRFQAGKLAPGSSRDLAIAATMKSAPGEASMLVVSPSDTSVYYYMEGMNAPMGNFRNYGHRPRAVQVVDRTLKERRPGVYSAKIKIPAAGDYDVTFLLDSPVLLQCFSMLAKPNPLLAQKFDPLAIEYLVKDRQVKVGDSMRFRFRLTNPKTREPVSELKDVTVLYYPASGRRRDQVAARSVGDGIYQADLQIRFPEAYYVFVASASQKMDPGKLRYFSLLGVRDGAPRATKAAFKGRQGVTP